MMGTPRGTDCTDNLGRRVGGAGGGRAEPFAGASGDRRTGARWSRRRSEDFEKKRRFLERQAVYSPVPSLGVPMVFTVNHLDANRRPLFSKSRIIRVNRMLSSSFGRCVQPQQFSLRAPIGSHLSSLPFVGPSPQVCPAGRSRRRGPRGVPWQPTRLARRGGRRIRAAS
jgi:hypothetical protein